MNPLFPHGQNPATGEGLPDPNDKVARAVPVLRTLLRKQLELWDAMDVLEDLLHLEWENLTDDVQGLAAGWGGDDETVTIETVQQLIDRAARSTAQDDG